MSGSSLVMFSFVSDDHVTAYTATFCGKKSITIISFQNGCRIRSHDHPTTNLTLSMDSLTSKTSLLEIMKNLLRFHAYI